MPPSVLVVGATGRRGGAVADRLLSGDHGDFEVRAMVRDPNGPAARDLADRGATIVQGDLESKDGLRPLVEDAEYVYGVTDFWEAGYDAEVRRGTTLAEVAAEADIELFAFGSVAGADSDAEVARFESKREIEERVRELDLPAVVVRPTFLMQNFGGMREQIKRGTLATGLAEGVSLQMVDVDDAGAFVAEAFRDPDRYAGEAYELAGDEHTLESAAEVFSDVLGRQVEPVHVPVSEIREQMGDEQAALFEWFDEHGYDADIEALRADHPVDFATLREYLREHGWGSTDDGRGPRGIQ